MRWRLDQDADRGETLIEIVISIFILGICVVAIGSGIVGSILISRIHRGQASADDYLHNYAEVLQRNYVACTAGSTTPPNYALTLTAAGSPNAFSAPTYVVNYWLPASAAFTTNHTCPASGDPGLQQVTLTLASTDNTVAESVVVALRSGS